MNARAILVTGAARGIGRATALAFAAQGDRVAVHHRGSPEEAKAVLAELPGPGHVLVQADITDPEQARRMVDEAAVRLGGLDVLVNNAGVFIGHPVTEVSYEQWQSAWQQTLAVNLIGPANVTWCAVQHMIPRGGGRIVNVSSRGAFRGEPGQPAYGASKGGLNAFGQSLALALGPYGIAVCTVAGVRGHRNGRRARQRTRRRPGPGAEPLRPDRPARRGRRSGGIPGLTGGRVGQRDHPRPERRLLPAPLTGPGPAPGSRAAQAQGRGVVRARPSGTLSGNCRPGRTVSSAATLPPLPPPGGPSRQEDRTE